MPKVPIDITNQRFGRFTAIKFVGITPGKGGMWWCQCDCGSVRTISCRALRSGTWLSCGCYKRDNPGAKKHGMCGSGEYRSYRAMLQRTNDPNATSYPRYGARGIIVCNQWKESFEQFLADVGARPSVRHSLERIDNEGDYQPGNVRWATPKEQARNRRSSRFIRCNGKTKTLAEWADLTGLPSHAIYKRLERGWCIDRALSAPLQT